MTDLDLTELASHNLLGVFGERDPQARAAVAARVYTDGVTFSDPEEVVVGREALTKKAQRLLDESPGFVFTPGGPVQVVQNLTVLAWSFGPEGQAPVVSGTDICLVTDGRISAVYTLLDPSPVA